MTKAVIFFSILFKLIITFGVVCLGVLLFALQFGFDWSLLLCACVWIALWVARWIMSGARNE